MRSLKESFRYNRSIYKEMYAIGKNDIIGYKRELFITELCINVFNCTKMRIDLNRNENVTNRDVT